MINISIFTLLALLEVMVVLLIVIGVLIWRARKARARDSIEYIDASDNHPTPALYLESEVAKTRSHLETLEADATKGGSDAGAVPGQQALSLRLALLEVEAELSHSVPAQRDHHFWQGLADRLGDVLEASGYRPPVVEVAEPTPPAAAPVTTALDAEDASVVGLVEQQAKTIDYLRNYIQELLDQHGHQPSPEPNIAGKFDELERANKELSSCVSVLEDENGFLREQIAALLKME